MKRNKTVSEFKGFKKKNKKFRSLEVWKFGWITRQSSQNFDGLDNYDMYRRNFACLDFINPISFQAARLPSFRKRNCKALAFTMADRRSSRFHILSCALAFTMAEILISLTIIGIIAAITLPALQANINEKTWATKRKALYSRMSQAISMMPSLNGYGVVFNEQGGIDEAQTASKAAQAFITDGLSKVLKINNICDGSTEEGLKKCGFPNKFTKMGINSKMDTPLKFTNLNRYFSASTNHLSYSQINTLVAAFETVNGESVLTFYNPNCSYTYGLNLRNKVQTLFQPTLCANFIYDLNGLKGPNKVGKDIGFMSVFYPTDSFVVAPGVFGFLEVKKNKPYPTFTIANGNASCRKKYGNDAKMANIEELKSVFTNNKLGYLNSSFPQFLTNDSYLSSTLFSASELYHMQTYSGQIGTHAIEYIGEGKYAPIFCVRK